MKTRGEENDKSKSGGFWRLAALGAFLLTILTFLVLLQSSQIWRLFPVFTASDTLILYALSSLNFFALTIFAFIFLRSVFKLVRERKALKLGSRLKTRLLIYFVAVSLLPITAMATFSYLFLNRALEKWFSRLPDAVIAEARDVQQRALENERRNFAQKARLAARVVEAAPASDETLRALVADGDFAALEIAAPDNTISARAELEFAPDAAPEQRRELNDVLQKLRAGANEDSALSDNSGFDAANVALSDNRILRAISTWHAEQNLAAALSNSPIEFERLKQEQNAVRQLGLSALSLLTFLLIFAASWIAFHLGRNLTKPISALAVAADQVAAGNFKHRVEVFAEDEFALLVQSFNQMATQIEENRFRLEERRRYIETVLQSLSTGVISLDETNRVTTINDAAKLLLQLENAVCENGLLSEIVGEADLQTLEKLLARARRLGNATEQNVLRRESSQKDDFNDNSGLPVALTATALRGVHGKNFGAVLMIEDLSELLNAQRAAAWQEVARRMAHEIKNPLTPIQLAAERIGKNFARRSSTANNNQQPTINNQQLEKIVADGTATILQEVSGLKSMVDEFSQFARLPHARLENADLNRVVEQTAQLYEDRLNGATLDLDLSENLPAALLDREQMRRVFVNLIDNALESFEPQQTIKKIAIRTTHDAARDLLVAEIADNGRGICPTAVPKLFQPYFSTKGRGTGLGLAIVQRIVGEHGGRIRAAANAPKGARFVVELPVANA